MPTERDAPFIDDDAQSAVAKTLSRILEHATPDSLVAGGASDDDHFQRRPRKYDTLKEYEDVYNSGGAIADLTDKRALMTYGTGVEFQTDSALTDDRDRTVDEWLDAQFGDTLEYLMIQWGTQSYWAGNAWAEIVESRDGSFSHLETIDPTTVDPDWDRHGRLTDVTQWVQTGRASQPEAHPLDPEKVAVFSYKDTPGGPLEAGLYDRNWELIQRYAANQEQRKNAIRLHGSPHYHVKVGSESQSIPDRLVRRVRDRFSSERTDEKTNWVTGGDIDIDEKDSPGFEGMESITETDMAQLAQGFGLPLELTNFGSDGLGSGKPAEVRWQGFERQARAEQTLRTAQFMQQVVRPILDRYSPFPEDIEVSMRFGDVVSDQQAAAEWMKDFKSYLTPEEVRERLDLAGGVDTEELGPPEGTPDAESPGGEGGLFASAAERKMADPMANGHQLDPETGMGTCENTDETIEAETMDDLTEDCPHCGQPLSVLGGRQATDAPDPLAGDDAAKRAHTDGGTVEGQGGTDFSDARALLYADASADALTQEELVWGEVYESVLWADDGDDRQLFEFDPEEVPQFVIDRLNTAVAEGAVFSDFETIPDWAASEVQDVMLDSLEERHGWSVDSIANNLQDMALGLDQADAERIARTETQALVNDAREQGYRDEFDVEGESFRWVGPDDHRTTDICEDIKDEVGDGGVPLPELKETVQAVAEEHGQDPREWTPHVNCRHTYVRAVS